MDRGKKSMLLGLRCTRGNPLGAQPGNRCLNVIYPQTEASVGGSAHLCFPLSGDQFDRDAVKLKTSDNIP